MRYSSPKLFYMLVTLSFLATSLTGCATFGDAQPAPAPAIKQPLAHQERLPAIPRDLRVCFDTMYALPGKPGTGWSQSQVYSIIGGLRSSELGKTDCGRRLLAFYDGVAKGRR